MIQATSRGGGGGSSDPVEIEWYEVIEAPEYGDPEEFSLPDGRGYYTLRPDDDNTADWLIGSDYLTGIIIVYGNLKYKALQDSGPNFGGAKQPDTHPLFWAQEDEIRIEHALGADGYDIRLFVPWFEVGKIVPVINKLVSGATRYYVWMALTYGGTDAQASIRWNEGEKRAMACLK